MIFVLVYLNVTLWVNLTDFLFSGLIMEYYHDEFFLSSFSYKIHHLVLCAIVAFIGSEFMNPSRISQNKPKVLTHLQRTTIPISISFLFTFLYELTWYTPLQRLKVFRTEITKVLLTIVYINAATLFVASWMW